MGRMAILVATLLALSGGAPVTAKAEVMPETAQRHMLVARYYVSRGDYAGAINRFKIVLAKFQPSEYVEEALAGLTEAYLVAGITSEARAAVAALECKFPDGAWTAKARALLNAAGLAPAANPASWLGPACQ